jgi:transcription initiation factor TFIIIB Brf1 subunit/transcription initiation factor TFIIB
MEMRLISKEFVKICPYCGSSNIENTDKEIKCLDCGMGKYKDGKRK